MISQLFKSIFQGSTAGRAAPARPGHVLGLQEVIQALFSDFPAQLLDLPFDLFVLEDLSLQKIHGYPGLFLNAPGGKDIRIGPLVFSVLEAVDLDKAFPDQLGDTVVDLAQTDAHLSGHVALGQVSLLAQDLEELVGNLFPVYVSLIVHDVNL